MSMFTNFWKSYLSVASLFKEKNGELIVDLQAKKVIIRADRLHFTNVLHNLIDNAIKYSEREPVIKITTENTDNELIINIKDNGIGIAERDQKQVFNKFFRVHTGDVHNVKGFGLGLYYVKEMIEGHKGKIELKSRVGEGSEFKLVMPLA